MTVASDWRRWLPAAVLLAAASVDLAYGKEASIVVTLVFSPFVAAAVDTPRRTAFFAVAAVVAAVALGWPDGTLGTSPHAVRVAAVAAGGALSVSLAVARTRNEDRLRAMTRVADVTQRAILYPLPRQAGGARIAGRYVSADSDAQVGGDFYEVTDTPFGLRLVVGDVRGNGLDAVRLATVLLGEFRSRAHTEPDLAAVAAAVDAAGARHVTTSNRQEDFATAVLAELGDGALRLVSCGHPQPLLLRHGRVSAVTAPAGLPLCLGAGGAPAVAQVGAGDRLVFFSDGAFEGRDSRGDQFDLAASVRAHAGAALDDFVAKVFEDLERHCAGGLQDDVVIVAVEPDAGDGPLPT